MYSRVLISTCPGGKLNKLIFQLSLHHCTQYQGPVPKLTILNEHSLIILESSNLFFQFPNNAIDSSIRYTITYKSRKNT